MSKTVTYKITKEMVDRISPNQTFDGYKDIAQKIGVVTPGGSPIGRDTKCQFFSDISEYVDFQSVHGTPWGMKAILVRDFDKVNAARVRDIPDQVLSIDVFQRVAAFQLMCFYKDKLSDGENTIKALWTPAGMLQDCGFVNNYDYSFNGTTNLQAEAGRRNIFNLKRDVKSLSKKIFDKTIDSLQEANVIKYDNILVAIRKAVLTEDGIRYYTVKLSDEEIDMYHRLENDLLSRFKNEDGTPCKNQEEIYLSHNSKSFYELLRNISWKYFRCGMIIPAYGITIYPSIIKFVTDFSYYFGAKDNYLLANETFARMLLDSKTFVEDQDKLKLIVDNIIRFDERTVNRVRFAGVPKYAEQYGLTEDKQYMIRLSSEK